MTIFPRLLFVFAVAAQLSACVTIGDASKPIATVLVPAPQPDGERALVVVLPGFGNAAEDLEEHGIAAAVHRRWPEADVLLTSATFAYYKQRNIVERLHDDVIAPARAQGYRRIWLAGASIGGMGVVFYEHQHPGEMDGLVLLAPWLGDRNTLDEIDQAGGIAQWTPGPPPEVIDNDNYERELWRVIKRWSDDPSAASRVWLICGDDDRLKRTSQLVSAALPPSHYVQVPGGHDWKTFLAATERIIQTLRQSPAPSDSAAIAITPTP